MAKYKIIPSSRTIVQSPISIGHKAEKGVKAIEFDLTAWVETYGSGMLTVIMRRWGDAIPYPIALEIGEDNKATWTLSDIDTAKAGMAYAQLNYIVGDEVVKKSDIYTFRVMDSLTGEGEPPEAYESWLEHLTHLAAEAMAEALDIEGIVTDKTLTVDGGIADGKATGDALALKADKSTTYTKTEVDQMIEGVEVETDTTLSVSGAPADAKKTGDELSALKADLNFNKLDVSTLGWEIGSLQPQTGEELTSNTRIRSDYVFVTEGSKIVVTGNPNCLIVYTYTKEKNYIASTPWSNGNIFTVPSGTTYVRILVRVSTSDNTISQSDVATQYSRCSVTLKIPFDVCRIEDFETLISELSDKIEVIGAAGTINILQNLTWENGTFDANKGTESSSEYRIRSNEYLDISSFDFYNFAISPGYKYAIYCYDSSKGFVSSVSLTAWQTSALNQKVFPDTVKYLRFLVANTSDSAASTSYAQYFTAQGAYKICNMANNANLLIPDINEHYNLGWVIGSLNSSYGYDINLNTRVRSNFIYVGKNTVLSLKDGTNYNHLVYKYNLSKEFVSAGSWTSNDIAITEDCYIKILVRYYDSRIITDETLSTVSSQETVKYYIPFSDFITDTTDTTICTIPENITKKAEIKTFKQKKTSAEAWGECDLKMMFFTDVHGDSKRTQRMAALVNAWGTGFFDVAVCGGDIVALTINDDLTWYYTDTDDLDVPLLNVIGNHDAWSNLNGTLASATDVYTKFIAPIVSEADIEQPENAATNGYNYYYKDFGYVRVIVLDCMYWDATQLSWFESVLADAKTNSKSVLCVSHAAFPLANMTKVDCLWSKSGVNTDGTRLNIQAASAVKDYIDADGSFIAWIVGHQHGDYVHQLPDYNNQFVINLASFAQRAGWLLKNTDETAYNYDCLTYIAVDVTNSIIKFMRIGANIDIYGTQYHGLVLDYANNQLISSY